MNEFTLKKVFFADEYKSILELVEGISKEPRYYQANTAIDVASFLEDGHRRILVKSPTGTGKTFMSKLIILQDRVRTFLNVPSGEKVKVLYIANKHRLNRQALEEYAENSTVELIVQSAFSPIPQPVIDRGWDIAFVDEAHHEAMMSIQLLLDELTNQPVIGFSADDDRGDGLLLKFSKVVESISSYEAAERGFIEKAGINSIIDTAGTDKSKLACEVLNKYHTHMGNTIIFFRTEKEVIKTTSFLRKIGCKALALTSSSTERDMDKALEKLSSGEIQFLVNCQKVGEGVDAPNITDTFLARSFNSKQEKKQYIGRCIRPDSPCCVWELANPLIRQVSAKDVVGSIKYERVIYIRDEQFVESLFSGEDLTWGRMSELRVKPLETNLIPSRTEIEANDIEKLAKATVGSPKSLPWTLKGQGIDTNISPSDNIIKLNTQDRVIKEKKDDVAQCTLRINGTKVTKPVSVVRKRKKTILSKLKAA